MVTETLVPPGAQPVRRRSGVRVVFGTLGVLCGVLVLLFEIAVSGLFVVAMRVAVTESLVAASVEAGAVAPEVSVEEEPECDSSVPEVPYEVFGSTELVKRIAAHLINHSERIDLTDLVGTSAMPSPNHDLLPVFHEAVLQNPYAFFWGSSADIEFVGECVVLNISYSASATEGYADREQLQRAARDTLAGLGIDATWTEAEKATAINNWILDNTSYDHGFWEAKQAGTGSGGAAQEDARGPLLGTGNAICGGYSSAFLLLAREAGLEAVTVNGEVYNPYGDTTSKHAWNRVKIDGTWTSLDVTNNEEDNGRERNALLFFSETDGSTPYGLEYRPNGKWMPEEFHYLYETEW